MTAIKLPFAEPAPSNGEKANANWLVGVFQPTALFSLRASNATSSGGKTLLVPSPYAVKVALVDAAIRAAGLQSGKEIFAAVCACPIRMRPPRHAAVSNTFQRVLRQRRGGDNPGAAQESDGEGESGGGPYDRTIAYREVCHFAGTLAIAIGVEDLSATQRSLIAYTLAHINYLGKRGSFMQFLRVQLVPELPLGFSIPFDQRDLPSVNLDLYGLPQMLDDLGHDEGDLFDRINTYSSKRITLDRERVARYTLLPYRRHASTRHYTAYSRAAEITDDL